MQLCLGESGTTASLGGDQRGHHRVGLIVIVFSGPVPTVLSEKVVSASTESCPQTQRTGPAGPQTAYRNADVDIFWLAGCVFTHNAATFKAASADDMPW